MIISKVNLSIEGEYQFDEAIIKVSDRLEISTRYNTVRGLGERYNTTNQKGNEVVNIVEEKFCNQGEKAYFPLPFFMIDTGYGFFIDTKEVINFNFGDSIIINWQHPLNAALYVFRGDYKEIIKDFIELTGKQLMAPKWTFGPWISAHRWNSQAIVQEVMFKLKQLNIPVTVMVLEQWSDEATFYIFNGAKYPDKEKLCYEDFDFSQSPWNDPKGMINQLHEEGVKLLLWQCPVVKAIPDNEPFNQRHYNESLEVEKNNLVVFGEVGPYKIPYGNWFGGSMIPDFTRQETINWWFGNRQYLLDIGVDGFKTDGGEFIHEKAINFAGETERELKNNYSLEYAKAYAAFLGEERVAFSRAGYVGLQSYSLIWAGDQKSTFEELRSVYNAAINASLCGQINWGFDIGGFSGELPSTELYYRATQLAVFSPIMQIHSEPVGGQFSMTDPTRVFNNERTPWNMASGDGKILDDIAGLYRLRMNLLPYIYSEYLRAIANKSTLLKHMNIDYIGNFVEDMFVFGDLIISPVLEEECKIKHITLPEGSFYNIFTDERVQGEINVDVSNLTDMIAFKKSGTALVTCEAELIPSKIDNSLEYSKLYIRLYGKQGEHRFNDNLNEFTIKWKSDNVEVFGEVKSELEFIFIH